MKKLLIVLTFAVALFITEKAQAQLNIHAAYAPELIETYTPTADTTLFFHGISFGLDRTFRLSDHLDLTAGAQYRMNLRDVSEHYGIVIPLMSHGLIRERQTLVDIPILLKYKLPITDKITNTPQNHGNIHLAKQYRVASRMVRRRWLFETLQRVCHGWCGI